jgi:hypothetical protein
MSCDSYEAGHRLHWSLWSMAQFAPSITVSHLTVDGTHLAIDIAGQHAFDWQHHDPDHLVFALEHAQGPTLICPVYRVLHIDGSWFSCAPVDAPLAVCA